MEVRERSRLCFSATYFKAHHSPCQSAADTSSFPNVKVLGPDYLICTSNKYHYLQMLRFRGQNGVKTEKCMQLPACTSSAKNVAQSFRAPRLPPSVQWWCIGLSDASGPMSVVIRWRGIPKPSSGGLRGNWSTCTTPAQLM